MAKRRTRRRRHTGRGRFGSLGDRLAAAFAGALIVAGFLFLLSEHVIPSVGVVLAVLAGTAALIGALMVGIRAVRTYHSIRAREHRYLKADAERLYKYMDPGEFEHHVADIFERQGYAARVTRYVGDHGIDIEMSKDGKRYAVQTKRYALSSPVTEPEVRNFYGSIANLGYERGYIVTSGRFTPEARRWVGARSLTLIDGAELADMLERYGGEASALSSLGRALWRG